MASLEPAPTGRITIDTSKGPLVFELWCKEVPTATRRFLEGCVLGKYDGLAFSVNDKSISVECAAVEYDLKDEFHSRIRWNQRGLLGCSKKDDSRNNHTVDSLFISLDSLPENNNKYIVFGRVVGDSYYNLVKIRDVEVDEAGVPLFPARIQSVAVEEPYFEDLPKKEVVEAPAVVKKAPKKVKVKLYDDEEEEEEEFQMKSAHELFKKKVGADGSKQKAELRSVEKAEKVEGTQQVVNTVEKQPAGTEAVPVSVGISTTPAIPSETAIRTETIPVIAPSDKGSGPGKQPRTRRVRDRTVDPEYDPKLDLSSDEEFDMSTLTTHKFKPTRA